MPLEILLTTVLTNNFGNLKLETENTKIEIEKAKTGGGIMKCIKVDKISISIIQKCS